MHVISAKELNKIFLEGSEHGVGNLMKEIWYIDSKRQRQQFLQDQSKNGKFPLYPIPLLFMFGISGARGNRWNMIAIRIGKPFQGILDGYVFRNSTI